MADRSKLQPYLLIALAVMSFSCAQKKKAPEKPTHITVLKQSDYSTASKTYLNDLEARFQKGWAENIKSFNKREARAEARISPGKHYVVKVGYRINGDGSMHSVRVLRSSHNKAIDEMARKTVQSTKTKSPPQEIIDEGHEHTQIFVLRS